MERFELPTASNLSVAIAGQAVPTSVLALTPRSLAFGNLPIHTSSAAHSVTVTNNSPNAVAITGIALRVRLQGSSLSPMTAANR